MLLLSLEIFYCYEYQSDKTGGNFSCAKYLAHFRSTINLIDADRFWSNFIYTFGKFWDPFSFALQTNVFVMEIYVNP